MSKNASNARTAPVSDAARLRAARTRGRETKANLPLPLSKPENTSEAHKGHSGEHKLGTFKGVLMPTCENMWGVIIFLRFYLIVGYAGLGLTILIVTLSFGVALTTALAMSAIATCGSHTAHGVYMMLVRALGKEIATATGIVYFLGFVCLAVLECLGACEKLFALDETLKLTGSFRFRNFDVRLWGSIFMLFCALCNYAGTKIVSQIGVLFFIIALYTLISFYISLIGAPNLESYDMSPGVFEVSSSYAISSYAISSYANSSYANSSAINASYPGIVGRRLAPGGYIKPTGLSTTNFYNNFGPNFGGEYDFSTCLAIFYPAFTGILSGANRAAKLRDPVA
jgi:hypothetical protein